VFTQCDICLQTCRMNRGSILPFWLRDDELTCILNKLVDAQTDNMLFLAMCHSTFSEFIHDLYCENVNMLSCKDNCECSLKSIFIFHMCTLNTLMVVCLPLAVCVFGRCFGIKILTFALFISIECLVLAGWDVLPNGPAHPAV
jgi:hypothetical protein